VNLHIRATVLPGGLERDLFVTEEGTITFDGSSGDARTVAEGGFVLPGLVDVHAHLAMNSPAGDDAPPRDRTLASARAQLAGGVLAIREPGAPNHQARGLGPADGLPRVFSAGRWLAPPGRFFEGLAREVSGEELAAAAVEESADGGWAKVIGDWREEGVISANYPADVLIEAVAAVHAAGRRMAVHAIEAQAVEMAVGSGCDSIEHGLAVRPRHLEAMVGAGTALVPTMCAVGTLPPPDATDAVKRQNAEWAANQPDTVRSAWEAGVRILAGTDVVPGHGEIRQEVARLVGAGLPPEVALGAASWDARDFLGLPGIEEGAPGDLVVFGADPLEDLEALAHPLLIVLDGRIVGPADVG
jgi:imidazolonepropionase-like amidohydrolase